MCPTTGERFAALLSRITCLVSADGPSKGRSRILAQSISIYEELLGDSKCDGNSNSLHRHESTHLTQQHQDLSTTSFEDKNQDLVKVSEDKQGDLSTVSTLSVYGSSASLKVVSTVLSTCPPDSIDENSLNAEGESSIVNWDNIQEATEDEF